jgi:hypothetical protein
MVVSPEAIAEIFWVEAQNIILSPSSLSSAIILAYFVLEIFTLLFLMT